MSDLISKENLIKAIVNTPTKQANTMQGYLDGIATRQLEIIDIINSLQTVSDKEIRDMAIEELSCKLMTYFADCQLITEDMVERYTLDEVIKSIDEIAEKMKEVGE